jgi:CubicO group peptidase (beta-lactamase class C family)
LHLLDDCEQAPHYANGSSHPGEARKFNQKSRSKNASAWRNDVKWCVRIWAIGGRTMQPAVTHAALSKRLAFTLSVSVVALAVFMPPSSGRAQAPGGCQAGFVLRDAVPGDTTCVTPEVHEQALRDNAAIDQRRGENAFGRIDCVDGFVARKITPEDKACVTPEVRQQILTDNAAAPARRAPVASAPPPAPIGAPPTPAGPQAILRLGWTFEAWARDNSIPNASMAVMRGGQLIGTYGWGGTWNVDTVAAVASLSKAITATCMMALIEEKPAAIDEGRTIAQVLPEFTRTLAANTEVGSNSIRVQHLLRHQSGLTFDPPQRDADFAVYARMANPDEAMARDALNQNGNRFNANVYLYNNINYAILGMMIKKVSGESYESYCKRKVLTPNGAPTARIGAGLRAMEAFGGWEISAREYAAFYHNVLGYAALSRSGRSNNFMVTPPSPGVMVVPGCTGCNYGLGVVIRPVTAPSLSPTVGYNTWHFGHWPTSSFTIPKEFGAYAARWTNGYLVVVIYDKGITDAQRNSLDNNLFAAANTPDP